MPFRRFRRLALDCLVGFLNYSFCNSLPVSCLFKTKRAVPERTALILFSEILVRRSRNDPDISDKRKLRLLFLNDRNDPEYTRNQNDDAENAPDNPENKSDGRNHSENTA